MSNTLVNGGLRLYKSAGDAENLTMAYVPSGDGTLLGVGDAVKLADDTAGSIGAGPTAVGVTRAAAGDPIYGVVQAFLPHYSDGNGAMNLSQTYRSASTAEYMQIRPANNTDTYCITDDGTVASGVEGALGAINIGLNANLVVADCSTSNGMSNMQLDGSSIATSATLQLKIVGVLDNALNDISSNNAQWLVKINNAQQGSSSTGVAGV